MTRSVSVVIPTYNRAGLLRRTLESLAVQRFPRGGLEVVVADDGSSDATAEVAYCVADRVPTRYHRQDDLGFRAGAARNGGARLASAPLLVFLDTGVVVGPGFVSAHHDAHQSAHRAGDRSAVLGYMYVYNWDHPVPDLESKLASQRPEQLVERLGREPSFRDMRHAELAAAGFDLRRLRVPWALCWSVNLSVSTDDFWAVGGFDEEFSGYGFEDVELGRRLARHDVSFAVSREAWGIESPHERDHTANAEPWLRNLRRLLDTHREPVVELYAVCAAQQVLTPVETAYRALCDWQRLARGMDVRAELAEAVTGPECQGRIAVVGCGDAIPSHWPRRCALVDFDPELLARAGADRPDATRVHAVGVHTPFPDRSFDLVVISSRLAGLWDRYGELLLGEARRIGRRVRVPLIHLAE
jgi:GT2 family glycosyltransferase